MSKEIYISSTPHETRLAIVEKDELTEIYYERENEYTLAGSIYNGKVTRVLPGMQSSFVDIGLERDAFLYITDFMEEAGDSADFDSTDGGGKGRGRGDRNGRSDRPREPRPESARIEAPREERPTDSEEIEAAPARESATDEVGEGAPGADGSRRWRGRRGRRRGRGESNGEAKPLTQASDAEGAPKEAFAEAAAEKNPEPRTFESGNDREPGNDRQELRREGGRGRGGRGRREGHDDRPREEGGQRQESVRDRFAPRTARHGGDEGESLDIGASAEPFILPGESLSKYRAGGESSAETSASHGASSFATPLMVAKPSTEVEPLVGWDGGAVLPGETLSRRQSSGSQSFGRQQESRSEGSRDREASGDGGNGLNRRRDRDRNRGGESRGEGSAPQSFSPTPVLDPSEAVMPAVTSQHEPEGTLSPLTDDAPAFVTDTFEMHQEIEQALAAEPVYEPETDLAPVDTQAPDAAVLEAVEEFHETVAEYEPGEDASASYRVDPSGPSEFRQSAVEEDVPAEFHAEEAVHEEPAPAHEFTSLQPTGEMLSDAPLDEPEAHTDPTSPIEHERAAQSVQLSEAASLHFEPGDGELEEELLDDEDGDLPQIHAAHAHDDMEEETLEHAADLGRMLRDMSIDQITRPEPVEADEEEDDFDIDEEEMEEDELASSGEEDFEDDEELSGSEVSEFEEGEAADETNDTEHGSGEAPATGENAPREGARRGRRDGRRGGRDRGERSGSSERPSNSERSGGGERSSGGGDRGGRDQRRSGGGGGGDRSRQGGRSGHHSMQTTDLPAISDLLKPGQEVLVQIAKEPIAKKGARITSHIALPGRFLVFMPTVNHVGVSRKIESDAERRRLKEVLLSEKGDASGGFIVRTAASGASEEELRSDLRFLLNLWTDIKSRSESSKSPALIYHDLNLVERILRDQVTDNFSAIWVDTEAEYERVLRFLQRFQPALIRRVKLYSKETPLFEQFGITEEINKALRAKVWLKSGGSIVINQTEALVAIDINTGKFVGKTARLEDTILKTNLDAIPEIVRQMRLRDLGGIIIIDFIDMDERKNRNKVMAALEEELKKDRAPSKMLSFNDFGLIAITRKRVKQTLERTLSTTCGVCAGTGMVKAPVTVCNEIYIEMRKMHKHLDKGDIMLRVNPEVVKQLKLNGGKWLQDMEELSGKTILVKSDPSLHPEQFDIH